MDPSSGEKYGVSGGDIKSVALFDAVAQKDLAMVLLHVPVLVRFQVLVRWFDQVEDFASLYSNFQHV